VFPFNRPLPPGEGDNQALAVNTEDGSVLYDVTFALVWADGDTALNRNEAYALASCRDCRTVAVAFQVVLLVGSVDVVVPQNLAAAVNYACVECVTSALATQLVVSLDGPLSEAGARDLAAVWSELAEFGEQIEGVPLVELRARLTEFEERILAVVRADAEQRGTAEGSADTDDPAAADPSGSSAPATGSAGATRSGTSATPTQAAATTGATPSGEATTESTAPEPTTSAPGTDSDSGTSSTPTG
jgi:putative peptide zinc metalloprotease protein